MKRVPIVCGLVMLLVSMLGSSASAQFPERNGRIAFFEAPTPDRALRLVG